MCINSLIMLINYLSPNQADNKDKVPSSRKPIHLDALLTTVSSRGITLNIWKPKESGKKVEWTSLLGGEKWLLLRNLPCHFSKLLPPERASVVQKLWKVSKNVICNAKHIWGRKLFICTVLLNIFVLILLRNHLYVLRAFRRYWT